MSKLPFFILSYIFYFSGIINITAQNSRSYIYADGLENALQNLESEDAQLFDLSADFGHLARLAYQPLEINEAQFIDFQQLKPLLNDAQIHAILQHRQQYFDFLSLEELQTIPILDPQTIERIRPYLTLNKQNTSLKNPKNEMEYRLRWQRRLELSKGFGREGTEGGYFGDANNLFSRLKFLQNEKQFTYGGTLLFSKDAGEAFWTPKQGFDFYAVNLFMQFKNNTSLKQIIIGDYTANIGQGLLVWNGFAFGKSANVLNLERNATVFRPFGSQTEVNFFRGVATVWRLGEATEGYLFASSRPRSANIAINENPEFIDSVVVTSFQNSGLHRTDSEIADKNSLRHTTFGASVVRQLGRCRVGVQGAFHHFDKNILPSDEPYNRFAFRGKSLLGASSDYQFSWRNMRFWGEWALSYSPQSRQPLGIGSTNGCLIALDKHLSISVLQRYFSKNYHFFDANAFTESTNFRDEAGLFLGFLWQRGAWSLTAYADNWRFSWWRFRVDGQSKGEEYLVKTSFTKKNWGISAIYRQKMRMENAFGRLTTDKVNQIVEKTRYQGRFEVRFLPSRRVELVSRVEWSRFDDGANSDGFLLMQDVKFTPPQYPLDFSFRYALFDTKNYQSAIYAFENDVEGVFSVVPYYYRGSRFYINVAWQPLPKWSFELRLARTFLPERGSIGSGNDEILGNMRTDCKVQTVYKF